MFRDISQKIEWDKSSVPSPPAPCLTFGPNCRMISYCENLSNLTEAGEAAWLNNEHFLIHCLESWWPLAVGGRGWPGRRHACRLLGLGSACWVFWPILTWPRSWTPPHCFSMSIWRNETVKNLGITLKESFFFWKKLQIHIYTRIILVCLNYFLSFLPFHVSLIHDKYVQGWATLFGIILMILYLSNSATPKL